MNRNDMFDVEVAEISQAIGAGEDPVDMLYARFSAVAALAMYLKVPHGVFFEECEAVWKDMQSQTQKKAS